ncbi:M3 family oligoendopeptidase [Clostridium algidicarnis]|uniref:M3 family oligoendopeptidase n=1 Tax=Clostridium algidicarnis TaxID=37659 RepID=A0ABS6C539_9CLOT|nr:M3 family oligoendopeptidase [Clostridium algidicarnis]MBU3220603.1 M3 family oligoendopeptidase [Clostridium algidicarnis]
MNLNWSLKELYTSFDSKEFKEDLNELKLFIYKINSEVNSDINSNDIKSTLEKYINDNIKLTNLVTNLYSFCSLTTSVDTNNSEALKNSEIIQKILAEMAESDSKYKKFIGSIDNLDNIIESSPLLKEHEFMLKEIKANSKYVLSDKEESIIAKMQTTGSSAFDTLKEALVSKLMVDIEIDGEKKILPLTEVRNLAHHKDSEVRKAAYYAELKSYKKIEDSAAAALNGIKGEVITTSKLRGYESPLHESLIKSRMDMEALDAMIDAMKEYIPYFRGYLKKKAEILGYKNGLPFYEMFAPIGQVNKTYSYDEAKDFVEENFRTFSDKLGDFAKRAFDENWIDVLPKEGKVAGAFCAGLPTIGESRIMLNFGGNLSDVITLAHELGHGYHGSCLLNESILNSDYPMPIAETASTFCETIVKKATLKKATKEDALSILESELQDSTQIIIDIYSRFLFEKKLFEMRNEAALTPKELNEIMISAQKEAYGDGLDQDLLHPYMWICKPHYYSAGYSYYNFPYAFGLLFAKGLYAEYLKKGEEFIPKYDKLLALTGKNSAADVTNVMNIDIHDINFWRSSLEIIKGDIDEFLNLCHN